MKINELSASNFIMAYKILKDISRPFTDYEAYKLGLIDKNGRRLKKAETEQEKESVDSYHRIVFNMKRLSIKMLGSSVLSRAAITLLLLKEDVSKTTIDIINANMDYPNLVLDKNHLNSLVESCIVEF